MEFQTFNAEYVGRLAAGDPETESHFSIYFGKMLSLKLRSRRVAPGTADDVRQETLFRVLKTLRQGPGVAHPERFGAFVNSVCNNVLLEMFHKASRDEPAEDAPEVADNRIEIDESLINAERRRMVRTVLDDLSTKDREILRLIFFEDAERGGICRAMGVEPDYLRVLLHRAKARFEGAFNRRYRRIANVLLLLCNGMVMNVTMWRGTP